ncbi:bifunctional 4-hydroxy-2-oxoglutarate aldolase/2-dehydro-3-deoxy-phosphogluconate aldolase [Alkalispirochaeta alkalica]|uniref:bifunctional 4-hydroxy-2-oxoglutarate aldolase/2-dehydro-3-deoxy-phosphogluconate aldolase n=1 Tax=Alkalispirochaeta alkalica TaxID=46356 RepID=UPI0003826404|nr:bifunctional 4-hydroxy-2-oxoglutarate aldolase/2-dehydro-3-deoxy-phosphogluconate aldolase [Alkalispirochaeta alkalica]
MQDFLVTSRVVAVFAPPAPDDAVWAAAVLVEEGFPLVEITFRNEAARDNIAALVQDVPGAVVGAGTVLTREQALEACAAGARFLVSPGLAPEVGLVADQEGIPYIPGVFTPSEIQVALERRWRTLKFFPAEAGGGPGFIQALAPVYPGVSFIPTGGVGIGNLGAYLRLPSVVACGGSFLVPSRALRERDEAALREAASRVRDILACLDGDASGGSGHG